MDLETVVAELMGAITIDGARTRLEYGEHKGLALAYSKGHKLTISRKGEKLTTDDVTAVRTAITAVTGQEDVKQSRPYQKKVHHCISFEWEDIQVRDFFNMSPEARAKLKRQANRKLPG